MVSIVFFLRSTRFTATKLHPVVKKWHKSLISRAAKRDPREGLVVRFMLDYLEDSVLQIEQTRRHSASDVRDRLEMVFKKYHEIRNSVETHRRLQSKRKDIFDKWMPSR